MSEERKGTFDQAYHTLGIILQQNTTIEEIEILNSGHLADLLKAIKQKSHQSRPDFQKFLGVSSVHIIDCDATPYIPNGWEIREKDQLPNRVKGKIEWDPDKLKLYLSEEQQAGKIISGGNLFEKLKNEIVFPANVLDYWLANKEIIPDICKGKKVYFWTVYRTSGGSSSVRYLNQYGSQWNWNYDWLGNDWNAREPAAVLAG